MKERPLIIMDKTLVINSKEKDLLKMEVIAEQLIDRVKKYEGEFVLLWHNSCFNVKEWKPFEPLYTSLLNQLKIAEEK